MIVSDSELETPKEHHDMYTNKIMEVWLNENSKQIFGSMIALICNRKCLLPRNLRVFSYAMPYNDRTTLS